jgi:hypothetical protein
MRHHFKIVTPQVLFLNNINFCVAEIKSVQILEGKMRQLNSRDNPIIRSLDYILNSANLIIRSLELILNSAYLNGGCTHGLK